MTPIAGKKTLFRFVTGTRLRPIASVTLSCLARNRSSRAQQHPCVFERDVVRFAREHARQFRRARLFAGDLAHRDRRRAAFSCFSST